jgi:hypothetical protein
MKKKLVAGALVATVAAAGIVGSVGTSASAAALPQQQAAATQSLATAKVLDQGAQPQFWAAIAASAAAAVAVTAKASKSSLVYLPEASEVSAVSSSSSSGGPATAPRLAHGVLPGDAPFNAPN